MRKASTIAAVAGTLVFSSLVATPAFAGLGVLVPAGDQLDFTPPVDWTRAEIAGSPRPLRHRAMRLEEGRSVGFAPRPAYNGP